MYISIEKAQSIEGHPTIENENKLKKFSMYNGDNSNHS